jgi:hypothetical protein
MPQISLTVAALNPFSANTCPAESSSLCRVILHNNSTMVFSSFVLNGSFKQMFAQINSTLVNRFRTTVHWRLK